MAETTWSIAYTGLAGGRGSRFEWATIDHSWPGREDALYRAKSGSAIFSEPSDFREPHPTVEAAVLLIERYFVFLVFPIHKGDKDHSQRKAINGVSVSWLESLRPTDGRKPSGPPGSAGNPQLDQMDKLLQVMGPGREAELTPDIRAAHQALHAQLIEGRFDQAVASLVQIAGPAYRGVAYAFFRNVIERKFSGTEHRLAVERYLRGLVGFNPPAMQGTDIPLMARFIVDQTGDGRASLGRTNLAEVDLDRFMDDALGTAGAIGGFEGLTLDDFEMYLQGAAARYSMGMD